MEVHLLSFDHLDSTNTWAKRHALELDPHALTCIVAKTQTQGRGRLERKWISESGNLFLSLFFTQPQKPQILSSLSPLALCTSLCIAQFLEEKGLLIELKWPNDLIYQGHKLGGILVETTSLFSDLLGVIVGIGINIKSAPSSSAVDPLALPPTYLEKISSVRWDDDLTSVSLTLAERFIKTLTLLLTQGFAPFALSFNRHLAYRNRNVHIELSTNNSLQGILEGVSERGALLVRDKAGELHTLEPAHTHLRLLS